MKGLDVAELVGLAALWGASFLLLRMGAGDFGPVALSAVRVGGAALLLRAAARDARPARGTARSLAADRGRRADEHRAAVPVLQLRGAVDHRRPVVDLQLGVAAVRRADRPPLAARRPDAGARPRPRDRLRRRARLAWDSASFKSGGSGWAVVACLAGTFFYGFSPNFTKRRLQAVPPLAIAAGSQLAASALLLVPALLWWPQHPLSATSWLTAAVLAFACTGLAYLVYFRLIARVGPANAITVTFLIPAFAIVWGWIFLGERVTLPMIVGCAVIVLGTALATGLLRWPLRTRPPRDNPRPARS